MKERVIELDFLKGVMIVLMVLFHLSYLKIEWAYLNDVVYTFHMSTFLIISGFFASGGGKSIPKILVPYVLFDIIYVIMVYIFGKALNATNSVGAISAQSLIYGVTFSPSGPYWYFHTLIICMVSHYLCRAIFRLEGIVELLVLGVLLYILTSYIFVQVKMCNIMYFLIGILLQLYNRRFTELIPGSLVAIVPFLIFAITVEVLDRGTLSGLVMTILMISFLIAICGKMSGSIKDGVIWLGKNTIVIFVFSPIFTVVTKPLVKLLSFDPTHILFALLATSFVIFCCILSGFICDKLNLSQFIFLRNKAIL